MQPLVRTFFDHATSTASHLVHDPATKAAAIIDPVLDFEPKTARLSTRSADQILEAVQKEGLDLKYVLETHAHADHLSAATTSGAGLARRSASAPGSSRSRNCSSRYSRRTTSPPTAASLTTC